MSGGSWEYIMGVMLDTNSKPVSGLNDDYNSGFIGTLTYPNDGTNTSKTSWTASDGRVPFPDSKYYDTYAYATNDETYTRRILGDATGEIGPFAHATHGTQTRQYGDEAWFIVTWAPWFVRSSRFGLGTGVGVFAFDHGSSHAHDDSSYRVILAF